MWKEGQRLKHKITKTADPLLEPFSGLFAVLIR